MEYDNQFVQYPVFLLVMYKFMLFWFRYISL